MRPVSCRSRKALHRAQTIFVFMLGVAVAALILSNLLLFLEYFEYYGKGAGAVRPAPAAAEPKKAEAKPAAPKTAEKPAPAEAKPEAKGETKPEAKPETKPEAKP